MIIVSNKRRDARSSDGGGQRAKLWEVVQAVKRPLDDARKRQGFENMGGKDGHNRQTQPHAINPPKLK
jgi:hypothetical protein